MSTAVLTKRESVQLKHLPKIGFVGIGWIGRHRLNAIAQNGMAEIAAVADIALPALEQIIPQLADVHWYSDYRELLAENLEGVVIATPSALHKEQVMAALEKECAVFCQKPLGLNAAEVREMVQKAKQVNRLLEVDFSYRHVRGMQLIKDLIQNNSIGRVYALNLIFHNAYGPDKSWFYDRQKSGGGCVIDLGIHLIDLALYALDFPAVSDLSARLFAKGRPWNGESKVTIEHNTIKKWAEERGGRPASVIGTEQKGEQAGLLRIDFPGYSGEENLQHITWAEFFEKFESSNLAFLYQDKLKSGERFFKFVDRDSVDINE